MWLIIGAGVSGLGAAKFLRKRGETVRLSERSPLDKRKAAPFLELDVELKDGGHDLAHLSGVKSVVASPGLPTSHPLLVAARARNLPVISEIDLALAEFRGRLIAVTGTNGKSTTCAMLGHVLSRLGRSVSVGGNFGDPPTAMLAEGRMGELLVLELSSYQLEQSEKVRADVAIFTSLSHDHMARHGSLAGYLRAKWRVFANPPKDALAIVPAGIVAAAEKEGLTMPPALLQALPDRESLRERGGFAIKDGELLLASGERLSLSSLGIEETHNQLNAAFTITALAHLTKESPAALASLLRDFRGLPHRCERLGLSRQGFSVINDSKSTNVESTLAALSSQAAPVVLLMGGQGKGESYQPVLLEKAKIAAVVAFGASGPEIARDLRGEVPVHEFPTLASALKAFDGILDKYAASVLFSPGCASFDEFENYEARGNFFKREMASRLRPA